jgi:hypothetical protein
METSDIFQHTPLIPTAKNAHKRWIQYLNEIDAKLVVNHGLYAKPIIQDNPDIIVHDPNDYRPFTERYAWRVDEINRNRAERGLPPV